MTTTTTTADDLLEGGRLALPPGDVARAALALARDLEPDYLANHSVRSWVLARVVASSRGWRAGTDFDDEVLFLACVLHDTGLHLPVRDRRFEVEGADLARAFAIERGLPTAAADTVWQAVALHTSPGIAEHMRAEVALTRLGIMMDFGRDAHLVPDALATVMLDELPRLDLTRRITDAIVAHADGDESRAPATSLAEVLVRERREPPYLTTTERLAPTSRWGS